MKIKRTPERRKGVCSVIIPVYNREATVVETVKSCLSQDYWGVEIILIDDGSTDASRSICEALANGIYAEGKTIRMVSQGNAGACVARNRGLALATGEFLLFLDSDDLIPEKKLSTQIALIERSGSECCISDYQTIDASGQPLDVYRNNLAPIDFIKRLKSPSNSAILMRRSSIRAGLEWNTSLKRMQDFDFMLRYLSSVASWSYVNEPLYNYRLHRGPRISDSYSEGMPYGEMFWSMTRHLSASPPANTNRVTLLAHYGLALLKANLKDTASSIAPGSLKRLIKKYRLKTTF